LTDSRPARYASCGQPARKQHLAGARGRNVHKIKGWRGLYLVPLIDQATTGRLDADRLPKDEAASIIPLLSKTYSGSGPRVTPSSSPATAHGTRTHRASSWSITTTGSIPSSACTPAAPRVLVRRRVHESRRRQIHQPRRRRPPALHPQPGPRLRVGRDTVTRRAPDRASPSEREGFPGSLSLRPRRHAARPGLPMCGDWSRLTFYPNHSHGHLLRYAMQEVMIERRLPQVGSWQNHLEAGLRLASSSEQDSAARPRAHR
jgi:hypothetical protein